MRPLLDNPVSAGTTQSAITYSAFSRMYIAFNFRGKGHARILVEGSGNNDGLAVSITPDRHAAIEIVVNSRRKQAAKSSGPNQLKMSNFTLGPSYGLKPDPPACNL